MLFSHETREKEKNFVCDNTYNETNRGDLGPFKMIFLRIV